MTVLKKNSSNAEDYTVILSFADHKLEDLLSGLLPRHFPGIPVVNHDAGDKGLDKVIFLTDIANEIPEGVPCIFFSSEEQNMASLPIPFRAGRLIDRIHDIMKGHDYSGSEEKIPVGPYILHMHEGFLDKEDASGPLYLTEKERDILYLLYKAEGEAVDRKSLLNYVWEYAENVETHTLETHIYRLRQKIEENPAAPQILLTDDKGYRLGTP